MEIRRQLIVFDTADLETESAFWARMLGGEVDADVDDGWYTILVDGKPQMCFQHAPDHVPPDWPDGAPQQVHLDLYVDDIATAHAETMANGARLLQAADTTAAEGFQVYADPSGHPFCLCWG